MTFLPSDTLHCSWVPRIKCQVRRKMKRQYTLRNEGLSDNEGLSHKCHKFRVETWPTLWVRKSNSGEVKTGNRWEFCPTLVPSFTVDRIVSWGNSFLIKTDRNLLTERKNVDTDVVIQTYMFSVPLQSGRRPSHPLTGKTIRVSHNLPNHRVLVGRLREEKPILQWVSFLWHDSRSRFPHELRTVYQTRVDVIIRTRLV